MSPDPSTGVWIVSAMRIACGWGAPPESAWPYDGNASHWPPVEPLGIDVLAKPNRIAAYERARTVQDCTLDEYVQPGGDPRVHLRDGADIRLRPAADNTAVLYGHDVAPSRFRALTSNLGYHQT